MRGLNNYQGVKISFSILLFVFMNKISNLFEIIAVTITFLCIITVIMMMGIVSMIINKVTRLIN
jgi:hypothetical protein